LGYTTGDAICQQPTSLFTLSAGGTVSDMTFVLDNGDSAPTVKGIATGISSVEIKTSIIVENGSIILKNSTDEVLSLELYHLSGTQIARSLTNQLTIPSSANKGVYLLRVRTSAQELSYKVVL
jgi:hypothetical protein